MKDENELRFRRIELMENQLFIIEKISEFKEKLNLKFNHELLSDSILNLLMK